MHGDAVDVEARVVAVELAGAGAGEAIEVAEIPGVPVALDDEGGRDVRDPAEGGTQDRLAGGRVDGIAGETDEVGPQGGDYRRQPLLE